MDVLISLSLRSFRWSWCNSEAVVMEKEPLLETVVEKGLVSPSLCFYWAPLSFSEIESELAMILKFDCIS